MATIPAGMLGYVTYELSQKLLSLTTQQRNAISVIVSRHHIGGEPLAALFRGEGKVCSERTYYNTKNGWHHNEQFTDALSEAARLALQGVETDRQRKLQGAMDLAVDNASNAVQTWLDLMSFSLLDPKTSSDAAQRLLDLAFKAEKGSGGQGGHGSDEADWWEAVNDDSVG